MTINEFLLPVIKKGKIGPLLEAKGNDNNFVKDLKKTQARKIKEKFFFHIYVDIIF